MKRVTVVVPNWNGMGVLKECLDSLMRQDTDDFEILLVDNASEDESVSFVRANYPSVRIIENKENLGFAGGVNVGIRAVTTPYVLLLNNDVEADPHFVAGLTDCIEHDPRIFSASARMINFRERDILDDCGDLYTILGWQAQRGVGQKVTDPKYFKPCKVFSACGGAAVYRMEALEKTGLFDEQHFAYLEDIDIGYRGLLYGYKNVYCPDAVVYHIGSAASGAVRYSDFKVKLSARNSVYLYYKNMPAVQRILNGPWLALGRCIKKRFFKKRGFLEAYQAGVREGFETRKTTKKVPFEWKRFFRYFYIEGLLISGLFAYSSEFMKRRFPGASKKGDK